MSFLIAFVNYGPQKKKTNKYYASIAFVKIK
jgi:hypothetical protein